MAKIDKLTPAQEASIEVYRDNWIEIGLSTTQSSKDECRQAVELAYTLAKMKLPTHFVFLDGPTIGTLAANYADEIYAALLNGSMTDENAAEMISNFPKKNLEFVHPVSYGSQSAGWASFYSFFNDHFGLAEEALGLINIAKTCGWVWMYEDLVIVTSKPNKISMRNGLTHCENGPSISYNDGTEIYSYDGVNLPKEWVLQKDTIDPGIIMAHTDIDVRAKGIALIGYSKMKKKLGYKILDGDPETDIGALIELTIPGLRRPGRFLEAICPRNGPVFLGISEVNPVDDKPINTAIGAQAFLAHVSEDEYMHPIMRT